MKRELRDKWVAALRSGEYQKGRGNLVHPSDNPDPVPSYCCLGVLAEVMGLQRVGADTGFLPPENMPELSGVILRGYLRYRVQQAGHVVVSEGECVRFLELPGAPTVHEQETLADMNDATDADFDGIATFIEQYIPVEDTDT